MALCQPPVSSVVRFVSFTVGTLDITRNKRSSLYFESSIKNSLLLYTKNINVGNEKGFSSRLSNKRNDRRTRLRRSDTI